MKGQPKGDNTVSNLCTIKLGGKRWRKVTAGDCTLPQYCA